MRVNIGTVDGTSGVKQSSSVGDGVQVEPGGKLLNTECSLDLKS